LHHVIDIHSHVLPGVDDGPDDVRGSVHLARRAAQAGTTQLVATPHVSWEMPTAAATMLDGVAALQDELDARGIPVRLRTGAELALTKAVEMTDDELMPFRLGGGDWLLVECPLMVAAPGVEQMMFDLQDRGHGIVLGHPERSPALQSRPDVLRRLTESGMVSSITAGSLIGAFGATVQRCTYELVAQGLVHNVTSDAHNTTRRPPEILPALEEADRDLPGLMDLAGWLCFEVPEAILDGGPIPSAPAPPPQRRRRWRPHLR
jgi:protein-tyrosine phosphatase